MRNVHPNQRFILETVNSKVEDFLFVLSSSSMLSDRRWRVCEQLIRHWRHHTTFNNCPSLPSCFGKLFVRIESLHCVNAVNFYDCDKFGWVFFRCACKKELPTHPSHFLFL